MQFILRADNLEITELEEETLEKRLQRLKKYLQPPFDIEVMVKRDAKHKSGDVISCRVHVKMAGVKKAVYAERRADTVETACDVAIDVVERNLRRIHDKSKRKR